MNKNVNVKGEYMYIYERVWMYMCLQSRSIKLNIIERMFNLLIN